jgi:alpha-1,3-rhamnosyl/mannosyltransferase
VDVVQLGTRFSAAAVAKAAASADVPATDRTGVPLLVSPYNLEPRKNLTTLVRAGASLRRRWPSLTLLVYGRAAVTPRREAEFERLLAAEGMGDAVRRVGLLDDAQVAALCARADVFVFPSLYEGFGLPVLEAMASGTPVVTVRDEALVEVAGDAAVVVAEDGLAAGIRLALAHREALVAAGLERARAFSWRAAAERTVGVYREALGR